MLFAFPKEQLSLHATRTYRWWTTAWCSVTGRSSSQTPRQQATPPRCRPCSPPSWKTLHPRWAKQRPFTQGQQNKDPKTMFLQQAPRHKEVDTHLTYLCVCAQCERNIDWKPAFLQQAPRLKEVNTCLTDILMCVCPRWAKQKPETCVSSASP